MTETAETQSEAVTKEIPDTRGKATGYEVLGTVLHSPG